MLFAALAILCFCSGAGAQVPNAGFENWQNVSGWYDNPTGWKTNNFQLMSPVVRDSTPHQGNFGMKVKAGGVAWTKFFSGGSPQSIKAYVKGILVAGDTAVIMYFVTKNGTGAGAGVLFITSSIPTWSLVTLTVTTTAQADSIEIYVSGGEEQGTTFSVDDFSTTGLPTSLSGIESEPCRTSIFPNPMGTGSTLDFCLAGSPGAEAQKDVRFFNSLGSLVRKVTVTGKSYFLERGNLEPGLYFVTISGGPGDQRPVRLMVSD